MDNITKMFNLFKKDCEIFVETGTYLGGSIDRALELGFSEIYSIEFNKSFYEETRKRLEGYDNIHLFHGDSAQIFPSILSLISDKKIFFWLDAHDTFGTGGGIPMKQELHHIKAHKRNDHTIMIDDVPLYFGDGIELENLLLEINPSYQIERIDPGSPSRPGYVMVAYAQ